MSNSVVSTNYDYLNYNEWLVLNKCPYKLTLSIEELTKPAVKKRDKSPRPQNSWIIFRRDHEAHLRLCNQHVKLNVKETAKECSLKWKMLSSEVKYFFKILEKIACKNHQNLYPDYKYKPKNAKDSKNKGWTFREEKKYAFVPLSNSSPMSNNSPLQTTNDSGNSINDTFNEITSLGQLDFSFNVDNNHQQFSFLFENDGDGKVSLPPNQFITNNPTTISSPSPLSESQSLLQLFILGNYQFEDLLDDNLSFF
ncbi:8648_t:CDS:1 [Ambispora gerdemannii]|uniref:8648_t:CDS:1 n=1 Tax=Ambispora gerdemannii TaxID=144530 RepID=A0A9N9BXI4_9GLOM|nr:8648_t:CDS:1 [Ambispora gerdemannii]